MDTTETNGPAIRKVQAKRISTADPSVTPTNETVEVIVEAPLIIDVEGIEHYTILCTPIDKLAMAAGFLFSEGVIDGLEDVVHIEECEDEPGVIRVRLRGDMPRIMEPGRNLVIVSSCGACGTEDFNNNLNSLPKVEDSLRIESSLLRSANNEISSHQPLFKTCGGTHIVSLNDSKGNIISCAEDTGRHNALDKAIGKSLFEGVSIKGSWAVLSGRISFEMVGKCARAGIELISAISAPTALAIDVAERCGITLCAFVRETRATVFTHPHRINGL